MSVTGQQLNGATVNLRGLTLVCDMRFVAGTDQILLAVGTFSPGAAFYVHSDLHLSLYTDGASDVNCLPYANSIIANCWYSGGLIIDATGNASIVFGTPRPGPNAPNGRITPYVKQLGTVANSTGVLQLLGYQNAFGSTGTAVRRLKVWQSALSLSQLTAAIQPGIVAGSAWGTGGLPAAPDGFFELANDTDLTDHVGTMAAFTQVGTNAADTNYTPVPDPTTVTRKINCLGDSRTSGANQNIGGYPAILGALRTADTVTNYGFPGQTISSIADKMQGSAGASVLQSYDPTVANITLLEDGVNDAITGGISAATMSAQRLDQVTLLQATGQVVIGSSGIPYASGGGYTGQATFAAYVALDQALASSYDAYVDSFSDAYYVPTDGTKYDGDQLHLLQATGYTHLALVGFNPAIDAWLNLFGNIRVLQKDQATSVGTGITLSKIFPVPVTTGSCLTCFVECLNATSEVITVADDVNGSWGAAILSVNDGVKTTALFAFPNTAAGTPTVTASFSVTTTLRALAIQEVRRAQSVQPDGFAGQPQASPGAGTDAITSGNATNAQQPALVLALSCDHRAISPVAPASGTGFTNEGAIWTFAGGNQARLESKRVTATGAQAATFTGTAGVAPVTIAGLFDETGAGGAAADSPPLIIPQARTPFLRFDSQQRQAQVLPPAQAVASAPPLYTPRGAPRFSFAETSRPLAALVPASVDVPPLQARAAAPERRPNETVTRTAQLPPPGINEAPPLVTARARAPFFALDTQQRQQQFPPPGINEPPPLAAPQTRQSFARFEPPPRPAALTPPGTAEAPPLLSARPPAAFVVLDQSRAVAQLIPVSGPAPTVDAPPLLAPRAPPERMPVAPKQAGPLTIPVSGPAPVIDAPPLRASTQAAPFFVALDNAPAGRLLPPTGTAEAPPLTGPRAPEVYLRLQVATLRPALPPASVDSAPLLARAAPLEWQRGEQPRALPAGAPLAQQPDAPPLTMRRGFIERRSPDVFMPRAAQMPVSGPPPVVDEPPLMARVWRDGFVVYEVALSARSFVPQSGAPVTLHARWRVKTTHKSRKVSTK